MILTKHCTVVYNTISSFDQIVSETKEPQELSSGTDLKIESTPCVLRFVFPPHLKKQESKAN